MASAPTTTTTTTTAFQRKKTMEILIGGTAASGAVVFTNPLEVLKTRFQLQGELTGNVRSHYKGLFQGFGTIVKSDGIAGLQKGLAAGMSYQFVMNGVRLGLHGPVKTFLGATDPHESFYFIKSVAAGAFVGALGAGIGSPLKLVTSRMQAQSNIAIGTQHFYKNFRHALMKIGKEEGVNGLWRGAEAAVLRVSVGSSVQLGTYDESKFLIQRLGFIPDGLPLFFASALVSGIAVTIAMNPFDVVSTRIYMQNKNDLYSGVFDCIVKTWKAEGIVGFYKGFWSHYLRLGPHTCLTFVFWEQLKQFAQEFGV